MTTNPTRDIIYPRAVRQIAVVAMLARGETIYPQKRAPGE